MDAGVKVHKFLRIFALQKCSIELVVVCKAYFNTFLVYLKLIAMYSDL